MVNIGARVATVNIAFSNSRNADLIERKILQYTTLSIKFHHCTMSELKNPNFHLIIGPCSSLTTLRGSETTLKARLFNKIC